MKYYEIVEELRKAKKWAVKNKINFEMDEVIRIGNTSNAFFAYEQIWAIKFGYAENKI